MTLVFSDIADYGSEQVIPHSELITASYAWAVVGGSWSVSYSASL